MLSLIVEDEELNKKITSKGRKIQEEQTTKMKALLQIELMNTIIKQPL